MSKPKIIASHDRTFSGDTVRLRVACVPKGVSVKTWEWQVTGPDKKVVLKPRGFSVNCETTGFLNGDHTYTVHAKDDQGGPVQHEGKDVTASIVIPHNDRTRLDALAEQVTERGLTVSAQKGSPTNSQAFWVAIRQCVGGRTFDAYTKFIKRVLCEPERNQAHRVGCGPETLEPDPCCYTHGIHGYELLKAATELFLICHCCGRVPEARAARPVEQSEAGPCASHAQDSNSTACCDDRSLLDAIDCADPTDLRQRGVADPTLLQEQLGRYLTARSLPYIQRILENLNLEEFESRTFPFCDNSIRAQPCLFELIWSYWLEEGMLVQTINSIALRFQNRRVSGPGRDPLANFELNPLRPLNNMLWGYIQDEQHRLTVRRRAYEYDHHYGLKLLGKSVGGLRSADPRSRFLEAFHNLLHEASAFYKEDSHQWITPDTFPLLNAIRAVHLVLAEGAHNQWGDLPSTARGEMLIQKWLLAQPPMREFLQSRAMVPYPEGWMGQVDAMKQLMGWSDVSVIHFNRLAVVGEQILLSIRFDDWNDTSRTGVDARNWAIFWRPEIQDYIQAYKSVTGVDLAGTVTQSRRVDATVPGIHLQKRLAAQQQRAGVSRSA